MTTPKFAEIEAFKALMVAGTTKRAAASLGLTQPAVSQAIQRLEKSAGLALFDRRGNRLMPTPEAFALKLEVERVFIGLDAIEHKLKSLKSAGVNQLEICSYPAFGLEFMPRAIRLLHEEMQAKQQGELPHISLQVLNSKDVLNHVANARADFGLMADELPLTGTEHSEFARYAGVIVMADNHPLARHRSIQAKHLSEVPFIALNPEDASRRRLEAALDAQGITLNPVMHTPYAASVCELALQGLGVGLVNPVTALAYAHRGLAIRRFAVEVEFTCQLVMPPGRVLSGHARQLLAAMRKQLAQDKQRLNALLKL